MSFNSFTCKVIYLCCSLAEHLLEYASHRMVTGFIAEGRVLGRLPSDVLHQHVYIT